MDRDRGAHRRRAVVLLVAFMLLTCTVLAEEGMLVLVVMDTEQHPFANVRIGTAGDAGSPQFSDQNGKARLKLAPGTKPAAWVTLLLMSAPNDLDLAFISPYDGRIRVPPFDNEQDNYDPVILAKRGDKNMLESGSGMLAIHANVNRTAAAQKKKPAPHRTSRNDSPIRRFGRARLQTVAFRASVAAAGESSGLATDEGAQNPALAAVAEMYGLSVPDIEAAIDHWGGGDLTWKVILLNSLLDDGGTDPFIAIRAPEGNITFGSGSWNFRDCTLQPLLLKLQQADPQRFATIMGRDTAWLTKTMHIPCKAAFTIASERLLASRNTLDRTWRRRFIQLGNEHAFQHVQVEQMSQNVQAAQAAAEGLGLQSEEAVTFCYDMMVEHGSAAIEERKSALVQDVAAFQKQAGREPDEQERLQMLANRMIQQAKQQSLSPEALSAFVARASLLSRGWGSVGGRPYELAAMGISVSMTPAGSPIPLVDNPAVLARLQDGWIPGEEQAPIKDGDGTVKTISSSTAAAPAPAASAPAAPTISGAATPTPHDGGPAAAGKALRESTTAADAPSQTPPAQFDAGAEQQLVELINQERAKVRLRPVHPDASLTEAARKHSVLMAQHRKLSHQFPGEPELDVRLAQEKVRSDYESENVAMAPDAAMAHQALMQSPAHRGAILNPRSDTVGVGVVRSGQYLYVTQEFAHVLPNFSNADAVNRVQTAIAKFAASHSIPEPLPQPGTDLQQIACGMAAKGQLDTAAAKQISGVRRVFVWTTADVDQLPGNVKEALSQPLPTSYAVDACFASGANYPGGTYWIVMVTY